MDLKCVEITGQSHEECTSTTKNINVGIGEKIGTLHIYTYKFELHKDQEEFNQGYKFVYKGGNVMNSGTSFSLEQEGWYEFKWKPKDKGKVGYLVKKEKKKLTAQ